MMREESAYFYPKFDKLIFIAYCLFNYENKLFKVMVKLFNRLAIGIRRGLGKFTPIPENSLFPEVNRIKKQVYTYESPLRSCLVFGKVLLGQEDQSDAILNSLNQSMRKLGQGLDLPAWIKNFQVFSSDNFIYTTTPWNNVAELIRYAHEKNPAALTEFSNLMENVKIDPRHISWTGSYRPSSSESNGPYL